MALESTQDRKRVAARHPIAGRFAFATAWRRRTRRRCICCTAAGSGDRCALQLMAPLRRCRRSGAAVSVGSSDPGA